MIDQAAGTTVVAGSVDGPSSGFAAGDVITVERTYTAGTPTPMTDTSVTITYRG